MKFIAIVGAGLLALTAQESSAATRNLRPPLDKLVVSEVVSLCLPNDADPAKVLAAADAAGGWTRSGNADLDRRGRTKSVGGEALILLSSEKVNYLNNGTALRLRNCNVGTHHPTPGLIAAVSAYFGRGPTTATAHLATWDYQETPHGRLFLDGLTDAGRGRALAQGPIYSVLANDDDPSGAVAFFQLAPLPH